MHTRHNHPNVDHRDGELFGARPPWHVMSSFELASLLDVSLQTIANWRVRRQGPPAEPASWYPGHRRYYRLDRVQLWLAAQLGVDLHEWQLAKDFMVAIGLLAGGEDEQAVWNAVQQCEAIKLFRWTWPPRPTSPHRLLRCARRPHATTFNTLHPNE